jgi:hypothetical protein
MTPMNLLVTIIGLIILWIVISIPVYLAGKAVTGRKASFGEAMAATLFGPIVYAVTLILVNYFLGALIGSSPYIIALILAFIAWIWVYKTSFKTGWLGGIGIAILAVIIFAVMSIILGAVFGLVVPAPFFPQL